MPFTVKENIDVAGTPTTSGVPALAEAIAPIDAPQVERLRAAGAIPIGRTNLPDLGLRIHTDSSLRGLTRNPWDPDVTAGGSSGGEASRARFGHVAARARQRRRRLAAQPGALLRDRVDQADARPRPARDRDPAGGHGPGHAADGGRGRDGAARGRRAARAVDRRRACTRATPSPCRCRSTCRAPESRRVALLAEPPGGDTHPEIAAAVRRAGDALADAGYDVVEAEPPLYEQALDVWGRFLFTDIRAQEAILRAVMGADATRFLDHIGSLYPEQDAAGLVATLAERRTIARAWNAFLELSTR